MANLITGRLTTIIDADNSKLLAKIKQSTAQLKQLSKIKTTTVDLNNSAFDKKVKESAKAINRLGGKKVSIDANNKSLVNKVTESAKAINKLGDKKVSIAANVKTLSKKSPVSNLRSKKITVSINTATFNKKVKASIKEFRKLRSKTISLNAKNSSLSKITKVSKSLKTLRSKTLSIKVNIGNSAVKIARISRLMKGLKGKSIPIDTKSSKAVKGVKDLGKASKKTTKDLEKLGKTGDKAGSSLSGMIKGIGFTAISAGVIFLTKKILDLTIAAEQTEIAFQSLLDSNVGGTKLFDEIIELAKVTPFTSTKLNKAAKVLLSYGVAGEDIIPTLRMVGDVSAATGAQIENLALAFGQIKSTGRLQGQDLRQLVNAGFNPLQVISEKTGRSMSDLKDDMTKGLIPFSQVNQAFKDVTSSGGRFFKMMDLQALTVGGRLSTLKDTLEQIGRNLGEMAQGGLKLVVEQLIKAAEAFEAVTAGEGTVGQTAAVGTVAGTAAVGLGTVGTIAAVAGGTAVTKAVGSLFTNLGSIVSTSGKGITKLFTSQSKKNMAARSKFVAELLKRGVMAGVHGNVDFSTNKRFGLVGSKGFRAANALEKKIKKSDSSIIVAGNFQKLGEKIRDMGRALTALKFKAVLASLKSMWPMIKSLTAAFAAVTAAIAVVVVSLGFYIAKVRSLNKEVNAIKGVGDDPAVSDVTTFDSLIGGLKNLFITLPVFIAKGIWKIIEFIAKGIGKGILMIWNLAKMIPFVESIGNQIARGANHVKNGFKKIGSVISDFFKSGKIQNAMNTWMLGLEKVSVGFVNFFTAGQFSEMLADMDVSDFGQAEGVRELRAKINDRGGMPIEISQDAQKALTDAFEKFFKEIDTKKAVKEAMKSLIKNKDQFSEIFKEFAETDMFKDFENFEDLVLRTPNLSLPDVESFFQEVINKEANKVFDAFDKAFSAMDVSKAQQSIIKNRDEFKKIFEKFADNDMFKGFENFDQLLDKVSESQLPKFAETIEKMLNEEKQKLSDAFNDISLDIDISEAKDSILRSKDAFAKVFKNFAGKGIFKDIANIDELLEKLPKELFPNIEDLLGKLVDTEEMKISRIIAKVGEKKDTKDIKSDILKNKIFYEPLLAEFGFASFEEAFLKIPGKLLPQFKGMLEKLAPDFNSRLSQVRKNLDVFGAKRELRKRFKEGKFNDKVDLRNQEISKALRALVRSTPQENLPEVLSLINEFFPKEEKKKSESLDKFSGAVVKGSVAAHSALLARQEEGNEKKIVNNTALAAEFLKQINEGGIALKNVKVAR
jgi:tape measure domain-containing protein